MKSFAARSPESQAEKIAPTTRFGAIGLVFGVGIIASAIQAYGFGSLNQATRIAAVGVLALYLGYFGLSAILTWRGSNAGPQLATFFLFCLLVPTCETILGGAFDATHLVAAAFAFVMILTAMAVALFSESISDLVARQFAKRRYEKPWASIRPLPSVQLITGLPSANVIRTQASKLNAQAVRRLRVGRLAAPMVLLLVAIFQAAIIVSVIAPAISSISARAEAAHDLTKEPESLGAALAVPIVQVMLAASTAIDSVFEPIQLMFSYLVAFFGPFLVTVPVTLPLSLRWRRPARILVLRPFNRSHVTRPFARFLRDQVAGFGHIYTLADTTLHVPRYVRLPILLGQIALFSFRFQRVRTPSDVLRVRRMMRRTIARNLNWLFSPSKIFTIASTDTAWRPTVERLASEVELILIDLTGATPSVLWELQRCEQLGILDRVLVLVNAREPPEIVTSLLLQANATNIGPPLLYDVERPDQSKEAGQRIADVLARLNAEGQTIGDPIPGAFRDAGRRAQLRTSAITVALLVAWQFLILAMISYLLTPWSPKRTFSSDPIVESLHLEMRGIHPLLIGLDRAFHYRAMELDTGNEVGVDVDGSKGTPSAISISPDAATVAYIDMVGTVTVRSQTGDTVWRLPKGDKNRHWQRDRALLEFNATGTAIALGWEGILTLWRPGLGEPLILSELGTRQILSFSPNGRWLASVDSEGIIELWDVENIPRLHLRWAIGDAVNSIAWSSDGTQIASAGRIVRVWQSATGKLLRSLDNQRNMNSIAFVPNSDALLFSNGKAWLYSPNRAMRGLDSKEGVITEAGVSCDGSAAYGVVVSPNIQQVAVWETSSFATPGTCAWTQAGAEVSGRSVSH